MNTWKRLLLAFLWVTAVGRAFGENTVEFITLNESNHVVPCRIHLRDPAGKPIKAPGLPFWHDHFVCTGKVSLALAPGTYTYEIERGPEYSAISNSFTLRDGIPVSRTNRLSRLVDLPAEGWWPGEFHIHRKPEEIELHMAAENLHFAHVITWWDESNLWRKRELPKNPVTRFDGNRFYSLLGGEDERGGGALLFLNRPPMDITGSDREFPSMVKFLKEARPQAGSWVDIEKPFWWDVPLWLANGSADSIGVAHNHHHRGGMLDNEAWGKARDLARFGGKHGNGLWTQEIYFHILNCGFQIPPSAGSASGVLPNPVGYNRAYVFVEGEPSWDKWHDAFRRGRVFVSNGPLLRCRADGKLPGDLLSAPEPFEVELQIQLDSREPIRSVELIQNGRAQPLRVQPGTKQLVKVRVEQSGWFLIRAIANRDDTFRFACTAPWYVDIGTTRRPAHKRSAQFFLDWTRERRSRLEDLEFKGKPEVLAIVLDAEKFWQRRTESATVE